MHLLCKNGLMPNRVYCLPLGYVMYPSLSYFFVECQNMKPILARFPPSNRPVINTEIVQVTAS